MRMRRTGLSLLLLGLLAIAAAYAGALAGIAERATPWWLALGTTAVLAGMAVLGAARRGRRTPLLTGAAGACLASVAVGLVAPLLLTPPVAGDPLLLGLPRPTAIMLVLVGLLPLVLLPLAYAAAFEREVLSEDDLAELRAPESAG
jgi:hypothetical protein